MSIFQKRIGPVFLKEASDTSEFIEKMQALQTQVEGAARQEIAKQIKLAQYGELGEQNIAYELRNSGMDMYILHDIYLEWKDLSAQIDYIVVTRKRVYVIECKNMIGNIEIDYNGNFIRTYELLGKKIKEGIYSPITQNQRHLQVIKEIGLEKKNFLNKIIFDSIFDKTYKAIVVLANPKTYLNTRYAPKEVKQQVIRADQLIAYMKKMDSQVNENDMSEKSMQEIAHSLLQKNMPERSDYAKKYENMAQQVKNNEQLKSQEVKSIVQTDSEREELVRRLKTFRREISQSENIKPYYIFNDLQMNDLIDKKPQTKEELLQVSGFGNVKVEKYGEAILSILKR